MNTNNMFRTTASTTNENTPFIGASSPDDTNINGDKFDSDNNNIGIGINNNMNNNDNKDHQDQDPRASPAAITNYQKISMMILSASLLLLVVSATTFGLVSGSKGFHNYGVASVAVEGGYLAAGSLVIATHQEQQEEQVIAIGSNSNNGPMEEGHFWDLLATLRKLGLPALIWYDDPTSMTQNKSSQAFYLQQLSSTKIHSTPKELIETMIGGQILVFVTEVILAKLAGGIAVWLQ